MSAPQPPEGGHGVPGEENQQEGTPHDPRTCLTCIGYRRWTEDLRNAERSRLASLGVHQLEEVFC